MAYWRRNLLFKNGFDDDRNQYIYDQTQNKTWIYLREPITNVIVDNGYLKGGNPNPLAATFGRVGVNINDVVFETDYATMKVIISGNMYPNYMNKSFDVFDFNFTKDNDFHKRQTLGEILVLLVNAIQPPTHTDFNIYAKEKTYSDFKREYFISEF